MISTK